MLDAILSKRYIFKGSIHSPTPGDTHIVSEEPKGFLYYSKKRLDAVTNLPLDKCWTAYQWINVQKYCAQAPFIKIQFGRLGH